MSYKPKPPDPHKILVELIGGPGDGERLAIDSDLDRFAYVMPYARGKAGIKYCPVEFVPDDVRRTVYRRTARVNGLGATVFVVE